MKLLFLLISLVICSEALKLSEEEENQIFNNYLNQFHIRLGRSDNSEFRKRTFFNRFYEIEDHNASGNSTYDLGINEFSYLTDEELVKQKTGYIDFPEQRIGNILEPETDRNGRAAPTNFDWRNTPYVVRPVQNQGQCGSCWAFAAIGSMEGQMQLKKGKKDKLSEQEVIECAKYQGRLLGCDGGWEWAVFNHAKTYKGITTTAYNPYLAYTSGRTCNVKTPRAAGSAVNTQNYLPQSNEANMREVLYSKGPLYVTFYVSSDFYSYSKGIYSDTKNLCGTNRVNHAILLVGYGTENGIDYWILKNSWGTGWGESGYFRLRRGINLCGIDRGAAYPELV